MKLHIKCNTGENAGYEDLGIDIPESTEFRPCEINPNHVSFYYPNTDGGTFINVGGDELTVKESFEEVRKKIVF